MNRNEFQDSLSIRYSKCPKGLPSICDGCGKKFDCTHALDCKKGGLVSRRHNEFRDLNIDCNQKAGLSQVISEPVIKDSDKDGYGGLRADFGVRGFWEHQKVALFDVRIFNADAPSYKAQPLKSAFKIHRNQKKALYCQVAEQRRASFTPLVATCDAVLDQEACSYLNKLAEHLESKWDLSLSEIKCWLRARFQICILRSVSLCLRGSRTKWRGAGIEDGAGLNLVMQKAD
jgi:hypothetical protein